MIANGEIRVNGNEVTEMGYIVQSGDKVQFHDKVLKAEEMVYVLMNKPKDFITTTDDPQERRTVMELLNGATPHRIYPIGRLDRNTTGLLLFTNDGGLAEKLSHPSSNINKLYHVSLDKNLTKVDFDKISEGITLEDGLITVDELAFVDGMSKKEVGIRIHSGKNRIVRRIFESMGYDVLKLDRVIYAGLSKKDLTRGRWRHLSAKEIISLKHFTK
jgi:23S rRNA pseudouridine2605 synthase